MNSSTRLLMAAALSLTLVACAKKVKEQPVEQPVEQPKPVVTQPVDDGRYSPADLDTDSCLRQRVVYFDFDQSTIRPEFQEIMACHAKYLQDRPSARITPMQSRAMVRLASRPIARWVIFPRRSATISFVSAGRTAMTR